MPDEKVYLEKLRQGEDGLRSRRYQSPGGYYSEAYLEDYGFEAAEEDVAKAGSNLLRDLFNTVRKRKWVILALCVIATGWTAVEVLRIRPVYTASAIVEVKKENAMLAMPNVEIDGSDSSTALNTKMLIFKSRPLLEDVVRRLKLDENQKFLNSSQKRTRWETVKSFFHRGTEVPNQPSEPLTAKILPEGKEHTERSQDPLGMPVADPRLDRVVSILSRGLNVDRIKDTQALKISFSHRSPEVASLVANGVTERFIRQNFENKIDRYTGASSWLENSTQKMKAKVREAEQALANYTRDNNIFNTQGQTTLTNDRLVKLHDQAMRAEIDILLKRSLYEEVKQGRVGKLPEVFGDARIAELEKRLNDLSITAAQLGVTYGPEHENVKAVKQQMLVIQEQLQESRSKLEEKLKSEYERAVRDDGTLKLALEQAKGEAVKQDQAAVQYSLLKQDVDTANAVYTEFLHKTNQANLEVAQQRNNISVIQPAQVPGSSDASPPAVPITMAFLLSLAGGIGVAYLVERLDTTIKNVGDVNRYAQLPTLGVIPEIGASRNRSLLPRRRYVKEPISITQGDPAVLPAFKRYNVSDDADPDFKPEQLTIIEGASIAEAYRALRTSVLLSAAGRPPKTILFTSGRPAEGKTTTVVNTAISLAQLGSSVLIIDADLRKPSTHKGFDVKNDVGLSTYLSRDVEVDRLIQKLKRPGLSLLSCGPIPPNPAELISSEKMKDLLRMAASRYDHVIIDSPPLLYVTDSVILSTLVDGVILVVHGGKSTREVVRQSRQMLNVVGAKVYGVVLNNVRLRSLGSDYRSYYPYYGAEYAEREQERVSDLIS